MLATTEATLRRETAALLVQVRRHLCKLGDEVRLADFQNVEALLARTRQHNDPTLERLASALARECGLAQPPNETESASQAASPEPATASRRQPGPTPVIQTTEARRPGRTRPADRARELERLLSSQKARRDRNASAGAGSTAAGVPSMPPPSSDDNARPENEPAAEGPSVMARLSRLASSFKRPADAPAKSQQGPDDDPDRAKKKIMYRGRVIEV